MGELDSNWAYLDSRGHQIRTSRVTSLNDVVESELSQYDVMVVDHPESKDIDRILQISRQNTHMRIVLTRFNITQKTPEADPDFPMIFVVDKMKLGEGLEQLLFGTTPQVTQP